jgi:hypothetical protein
MQVKRKLVLIPALGAVAAGVAGATAFGAAGSAPKVDHLAVVSSIKVKPGFFIQDNLRYTPFKSAVRSGGKVVITPKKGAFSEGPHTFSLVKRSQLPKTEKQLNNCKVCNKIGQEHGYDPNSNQPPSKPFVDGGDGFNKPGDSVVFTGKPKPIKITAKKGTTLYYMCALHGWMQGSIKVK